MIYQFSDDKFTAAAHANKSATYTRAGINYENLKLAEELHKPIIRKFRKRKVYSSYMENFCGASLAEMQLINKYDKGIRFLLCDIDVFSKHSWVVPLKDKKGTKLLKNVVSKYASKLNKIR